jgi:hypothetical protein
MVRSAEKRQFASFDVSSPSDKRYVTSLYTSGAGHKIRLLGCDMDKISTER